MMVSAGTGLGSGPRSGSSPWARFVTVRFNVKVKFRGSTGSTCKSMQESMSRIAQTYCLKYVRQGWHS